ncbi:hypothetical protein B9T07_26770 [Limnospira fusiformis CCALA 023]
MSIRATIFSGCILVGFAGAAWALPPDDTVVRMAIIGSSEGDSFRTESVSLSIGTGPGFRGIAFGDPKSGTVGTAVGSIGTRFILDGVELPEDDPAFTSNILCLPGGCPEPK